MRRMNRIMIARRPLTVYVLWVVSVCGELRRERLGSGGAYRKRYMVS
jgi:hypothetical protein